MSAASETIQPANHVYPKISNRRTRTRVAKSAQAATQLLSVHCLYQAIRKSARGNRFFRTKVYRDGSENRGEATEPDWLAPSTQSRGAISTRCKRRALRKRCQQTPALQSASRRNQQPPLRSSAGVQPIPRR